MKDVLKNLIVEKIKGNNNQEITGQSLQDVLLSIVDSVYGDLEISMEGYRFEGVATVATIPPILTDNSDKRFYLAVDDGLYSNFTGLQSIPIVELSILRNTARNYWEAISLKIPLNFSIKNELGASQKDPISQKKVTELYNQGYKYAGIAHTVDRPNPLTDEEKIFMLIVEEGNYANYSVGDVSELSIIQSIRGSWFVQSLGIPFSIIPSLKKVQDDIVRQNKEISDFKSSVTNQIESYKPIEINGNVNNAADEEDLTAKTGLIKIADRGTFYGKGYKILRRGVDLVSQFNQENTIYEIRYDFDLGGSTLNIPAGCTLKFEGGAFSNGYLFLNNAYLDGDVNITAEPLYNDDDEFDEDYKPLNTTLYTSWFGAKGDGLADDAPALRRCVRWLRKNGAELVFNSNATYIMGDGLTAEEDVDKTLHTGYSYPPLHPCLSADNRTNFQNNFPGYTLSQYIEENPADIGRDISLNFFRFENMTIRGNGSVIKSHDNNGYCHHNRLIFMTGCKSCTISGLVVDGNRGNRPVTLVSPYLSDYTIGNLTSNNPEDYTSLSSMAHENVTWNGVTTENQKIKGWRNVDNIYIFGCEDILLENVKSTNGVMDGVMITGNSQRCLIDNSSFSHNSRHGTTLGYTSNTVVKNSSYKCSGYVFVDNEEKIVRMEGNSHIDCECESNGFAVNNIIENNTFEKAAKSALVLSRLHRYAVVRNNRFLDGNVSALPYRGCLFNEICYNVFEDGLISPRQEALKIHHNHYTINVPSPVNGSFLDIVNYSKTYSENYISEELSNETPACIIPTVIESNIITLEYPEGLTPNYRFVIADNVILRNNVFKNFNKGNTSWHRFNVKEFIGNTFLYDTEKYPELGDVRFSVDPFSTEDTLINNRDVRGTVENITYFNDSVEIIRKFGYNKTSAKYIVIDNVNGYADISLFTPGGNNNAPSEFCTFKVYGVNYFGNIASTKRVASYKKHYANTIMPSLYFSSNVNEKRLYIDLGEITYNGGTIYVKVKLYNYRDKIPGNKYITISGSAPTLSGSISKAVDVSAIQTSSPDDKDLLNIEFVDVFDKTTGNKVSNVEGVFRDAFGQTNAPHRGSVRPSFSCDYDIGFQFFDTTIGKPIWWTGTSWVDANGEVVP